MKLPPELEPLFNSFIEERMPSPILKPDFQMSEVEAIRIYGLEPEAWTAVKRKPDCLAKLERRLAGISTAPHEEKRPIDTLCVESPN
jgi:hypothetical protein